MAKNIYYFNKNKKLIISSELDPIVSLSKNYLSISDNFQEFSLNGYYNEEKTIYNEIFKQKKNLIYEFDISNTKIKSKKEIYNINDFIYKFKNLEDGLFHSVKKRMISDKELGTFLSGGVDSSLISLYAKKFNPEIKTFSLFYENSKYDEGKEIINFCNEYNLNNNNITLNQSIFNEIIESVFDISEPICVSSIIPTYILSKFAKNYVDVVLSGDGADEIFYGYNIFNALYVSYFIDKFINKKITNFINNQLEFKEGNDYFNFLFIVKKFFHGQNTVNENRLEQYLSQLYPYQIKKIFNKNFINSKNYDFKNINDFMEYNRKKIIDTYLCSNILTKTDLASMKASLELRSPFLDSDLYFYNNDILNYKLNIKKLFKDNFSNLISKKKISKKTWFCYT